MDLDALALEYKRDYGTARGNLNVSNLINNPAACGKCHVGLGLTEQTLDSLLGKTLRATPAMEAWISDHVWSAAEIAGLAKLKHHYPDRDS